MRSWLSPACPKRSGELPALCIRPSIPSPCSGLAAGSAAAPAASFGSQLALPSPCVPWGASRGAGSPLGRGSVLDPARGGGCCAELVFWFQGRLNAVCSLVDLGLDVSGIAGMFLRLTGWWVSAPGSQPQGAQAGHPEACPLSSPITCSGTAVLPLPAPPASGQQLCAFCHCPFSLSGPNPVTPLTLPRAEADSRGGLGIKAEAPGWGKSTFLYRCLLCFYLCLTFSLSHVVILSLK